MNAIITVSAILIGLFLVLTVKSGNNLGFGQLTDPLSKTFGSIITTLQGR